MRSTFARFPPRLQQAIADRLGWSSLRPVQELAGQAILDGKNAIVLAPTAGGKTEAAIFPLLANLIEHESQGVGILYIAPIKALLNNQCNRFATYTEMVGLRSFVWHGDIKGKDKQAFLKEPAEVLLTTPESLEVMLLSAKVPHVRLFGDLRAVIIDEIHALAGSDRGTHLLSVLERLITAANQDLPTNQKCDVQRVGLSATVGNPEQILNWMQGSSQRQRIVIDPPKIPAKREIAILQRNEIGAIAREASRKAQGNKSLFFCQSRALAEDVAERMRDRGTDVFVHHSSVSRIEREIAEENFQKGMNACILCTSTLELGIDIGDLDLVLQANAPSTVSSFLQRLGRTGRRAGKAANTTFYCENIETVLQAIAIVELARSGWVESVKCHNRTWTVLVHQLLALTLQFGAISPELAWEQLSLIPDFQGIAETEYQILIQHGIREGYFFQSGGLLSIGERAEKIFGRKNCMELYAVFSSPVLYKVKTAAGYTVGSLEQDFADKLVPSMSSFLLGGKAWLVEAIDHKERSIRVVLSPKGKKPNWNSFSPQILSYELCQKIYEILTTDIDYPYIDAQSRYAITEKREDLGVLLSQQSFTAIDDGDRVTWWTFAGGQINYTIKYLLADLRPEWKVIADNFKIGIEGSDVSVQLLRSALDRLRSSFDWQSEAHRSNILAQLPLYRFSKFQPLLPEAYALETIERYLLNWESASSFLKRFTN
ncbi:MULTISPECIES: DEAD/DEAH box helicase [Pseudanabaena]|uniref:DEAD/DEAH box helicase domain protein n=2 Tax=Pseudanabaena TaxID=1152 RepID=L8N368_9CYAN|nr:MULTISPECIES: DEAD/DEAH box helicase [Pseudanabaena]ELS34126.1 DEAD/DEAH box helicase domain protein [Pseudanabaena biceps PCC 7429]MDG3493653.1 DEAD/DEAH box helicase [Pseudanabaena catenata USMAC16]